MDISGAANSSILSLAKTEMSKMRAKKKFEKYGKEKEKKKIKKSAKNDLPAKFDHRNYGAWYINSAKWESRFHSLSDQKSVKILKNRRISENERQLNAQTVRLLLRYSGCFLFYLSFCRVKASPNFLKKIPKSCIQSKPLQNSSSREKLMNLLHFYEERLVGKMKQTKIEINQL